MESTSCPVPEARRGAEGWPEGTAAIANALGRVAAFRKWAEPGIEPREATGPVVVVPGGSVEALPCTPSGGRLFAGYRSHLLGRVSRRMICLSCFEAPHPGQQAAFRNGRCAGTQPSCRMPRYLLDGLRRGGVLWQGPEAEARGSALALAVGGAVRPRFMLDGFRQEAEARGAAFALAEGGPASFGPLPAATMQGEESTAGADAGLSAQRGVKRTSRLEVGVGSSLPAHGGAGAVGPGLAQPSKRGRLSLQPEELTGTALLAEAPPLVRRQLKLGELPGFFRRGAA